MPSVRDIPEHLKVFVWFGVDLSWGQTGQARGACPFCDKGKFYVNQGNGLWDCKVCLAKGNVHDFLRILWEKGLEATKDYDTLAASRGFLYPETLMEWGVVQSPITKEWLVPGYNPEGSMTQLYRYTKLGEGYKLLAAPLPQTAIHCADFRTGEVVYLCEGWGDGIALYELLQRAKVFEGSLAATGNIEVSLRANANVYATPGCGVFPESWKPLFAGKIVCILFDNDHPRTLPNGTVSPPGSLEGVKRICALLSAGEEPPKEIHYLQWGKEGFDPGLKSGYDVRDMLAGDTIGDRLKALSHLLSNIKPVPDEWLAAQLPGKRKQGKNLDVLPCDNWRELINAWRKALKWTPGLDKALSCMLASVASLDTIGDQLWLKIIGPASCGKSTLCEALSVNKQYIVAKSTIRGFHSGYKSDKEGDEDHSLIEQITGKTLVTKDGDTLLTSPNLPQILAEARDLYDCTSRSDYRHGLRRDYENRRMTWLLCGTASLRALDSSELGERFLDVVMMEGIDDEMEDEIVWRVVNRAVANLKVSAVANMGVDGDMKLAMQLTAGYVNHLRENAQKLLDQLTTTEEALRYIMALGKFVAFMRARPSAKQKESAEREFSARLASQLVRLANCLAITMNQRSLNSDVMERVRGVALDTARGRTFELTKWMAKCGAEGQEVKKLALWTGHPTGEEHNLLHFLNRLGAAEVFTPTNGKVNGVNRWRLTERMQKLCDIIL